MFGQASLKLVERVKALEQMIRNPVLFRPGFHDGENRQPGNLVGIFFCSNPDCGRPYDLKAQCNISDHSTSATIICSECKCQTEVTMQTVYARDA